MRQTTMQVEWSDGGGESDFSALLGQRVRLQGLQRRPELNGRFGRVYSYDHSKQRAGVFLDPVVGAGPAAAAAAPTAAACLGGEREGGGGGGGGSGVWVKPRNLVDVGGAAAGAAAAAGPASASDAIAGAGASLAAAAADTAAPGGERRV
mmetsp:Transcript_36366/g.118298  ORF Transcript_36366/g.118298 Transcript_36366/m.118298 type:complete len:150 (-) Transcript_36366:172-621(-)